MHGSAQAPDQVGSRKGLARAGLELGDVDLFELNEALAAMVRRWRPELDSRVRTGVTDDYCD
jgi:hypothetical protein